MQCEKFIYLHKITIVVLFRIFLECLKYTVKACNILLTILQSKSTKLKFFG